MHCVCYIIAGNETNYTFRQILGSLRDPQKHKAITYNFGMTALLYLE